MADLCSVFLYYRSATTKAPPCLLSLQSRTERDFTRRGHASLIRKLGNVEFPAITSEPWCQMRLLTWEIHAWSGYLFCFGCISENCLKLNLFRRFTTFCLTVLWIVFRESIPGNYMIWTAKLDNHSPYCGGKTLEYCVFHVVLGNWDSSSIFHMVP